MSSFYVDFKSRTPIYEQLVENISNMVLRGVLSANEPIPSVRQLASELGINPNTIHKAYAELERRGIIYSSPGRGSFVSDEIGDAKEKVLDDLTLQIRSVLDSARALGVTEEQIVSIVNEVWRD